MAPAEVAPALARAGCGAGGGAWMAGYVAYEAGYALEPKLARADAAAAARAAAGAWAFSTRRRRRTRCWRRAAAEGRASRMTAPEPAGQPRAAYDAAMARVQDYIAAGDCYQVNLTFPMAARLVSGTPLGLYGAFRRTEAVGHGAFVDLGVGPVVVSRSPELFFRLEAAGRIVSPPDEGHRAARCRPGRRMRRLAAALQASAKDRAENLMIVDLLRNDIVAAGAGRVGQGAGAVRDGKLFDGASDDLDRSMGQLAEPPTLPGADGGAVSLRVGHRRAEDPRDADHPRGGAASARRLLRRGRLDGTGRARRISSWRSARCRCSGRPDRDERRRRGGARLDRRRANGRRRCGKRAS